ncbi:MAG: UDP-glucose 4-epimerase GalE [Firmicutes bacterium]|nr:UDP-glucose 4-epimerase GalE [Bacillota bacterium]
MKVLVTGGAGYIGSTICSALLDSGHVPVILDSLVNGRIEFAEGRNFYKGDIEDKELLSSIFEEHSDIEFTIHCAALIVVPDSVKKPDDYYTENVGKSLELFKMLNELGCKNIVFSSSASIYDDSPTFIVNEESNLNPRSPYARTKYMMEMILKDFCVAYDMKAIALRYFNPIGSDPEMRTGSYIKSPSHILGKLIQVSSGKEDIFKVTGTNWDTRDGTGIRDYIHVWDLARAHVYAIEKFEIIFDSKDCKDVTYEVINLGNGRGTTVREMVNAFENVIEKEINKTETEPRQGDVPGAYANADKAFKLLGWKTELTTEDGIRDALVWSDKWDKTLKELSR